MIFPIQLFKGSAVALVLVASAITPLAASAVSQPRDCDANSIVNCGAYTKTELDNKIAKGDSRNSAASIQQIYFKEGRGITSAGISNAVDGTVFKDGRVVVSGKTVATAAMSSGRQFMPGSTKSGSVWIRSVSVSFVSSSIPAYVNMDGGVFHWAIIKSCGNTVSAKPVAKPSPTPTPTPTPTPMPTPTPSRTPTPTPTPTPMQTPVPTPVPTPEQPLPATGAGDVLGGAIGLGSLGYASQVYLRSKANLMKSLKRK